MATISVTVKNGSHSFSVTVPSDILVSAFKRRIQADVGCPPDLHRLIHRGRVLADTSTFAFYGIEDGHSIHFVRGTAPRTHASVSTPTPATAIQPNPFPGLGLGMGGLGGMGSMAEMQEQLRRNPAMVEEAMNSPMMRSMMENPDIMQSMMANNPQIQELMNSNPELRHALSDPAMIRQSMEMMRNPQARQQMQRSQELAMSQIENHPGGFQHLRRMYNEVQEPMERATMGGSNDSSSPSSPAVPTTGALPNPWASPSQSSPQAPLPNPWGSPPVTGSPTTTPNFANLFGSDMAPPASQFGAMPPTPGMGIGGMPTPEQQAASRQMLQNPAMRQMMSQMLSNPNTIQQLSSAHPELGRMLENPMMRNMLSDPNFLESMANMGGGMNPLMQGGGFPPMFPPQLPPSGSGVSPTFDFSNVLRGMNAATVSQPPVSTTPTMPHSNPVTQSPPSERFAAQNQQLQNMGFSDSAANLNALVRTNGNINAAVERLLGSS